MVITVIVSGWRRKRRNRFHTFRVFFSILLPPFFSPVSQELEFWLLTSWLYSFSSFVQSWWGTVYIIYTFCQQNNTVSCWCFCAVNNYSTFKITFCLSTIHNSLCIQYTIQESNILKKLVNPNNLTHAVALLVHGCVCVCVCLFLCGSLSSLSLSWRREYKNRRTLLLRVIQ